MNSLDSDWDVDEWEEEVWGDAARADSRNPVLTQKTDDVKHSAPAQKGKRALVAKYDQNGKPSLCCQVEIKNGKPEQVTEWHRPTADEYNAIMFHAKPQLVKGGVVGTNVPTTTNFASQSQMTPLGEASVGLPKYVKIGGAVAGVGLLGYLGWKMMKD